MTNSSPTSCRSVVAAIFALMVAVSLHRASADIVGYNIGAPGFAPGITQLYGYFNYDTSAGAITRGSLFIGGYPLFYPGDSVIFPFASPGYGSLNEASWDGSALSLFVPAEWSDIELSNYGGPNPQLVQVRNKVTGTSAGMLAFWSTERVGVPDVASTEWLLLMSLIGLGLLALLRRPFRPAKGAPILEH